MSDGNGGTLAGGADGFYQFSNLGKVVLTGVPHSVAAFHAQKLQPGREGYMEVNPLILAPDTNQGKAVDPYSRPIALDSGLNLSCDLMKRALSSRSNVLNAGAPGRSTENVMFNKPQGLGAMGPTKIRYAKIHPFVVKVENDGNNEENPGNVRDDLMKDSRSSELHAIGSGTEDKGSNNTRFNRALNSEQQGRLSYYQKSLLDRQRWEDANRIIITPPSSEPLASTEAVRANVSFNQTLCKGVARGMVLTGLSFEEVTSQIERFQVDLVRCQEVISTPVIPTVVKNLKRKAIPSESIVLDDSCAQAGNAAENALYNLVIKTMALTGLSYDDSMIHAQGYLHQLEKEREYKNTSRAEFYQRFAEGAVPRSSINSAPTDATVPQTTTGIGRLAELDQLEHRIAYSTRRRVHQESLGGEIKSLQIDMLAINEAIIEAKVVRERQRELIRQYELKRLDKEAYISDTVERSKSILGTSLDAEPGWRAFLQLFIQDLGEN